MFIEIDEKCIELLNDSKYITFFNKLAYDINNGKNYIFLPKKTLDILYNSKNIDNHARKIYKNIFDKSSEGLSVKKSVNRKIIIIPNNNESIRKNKDELLIPIDIAIDINLFENKINLICENLSDCKFFYNIGKLYKIKNSITGIDINMQKNNGGGSTIVDVYKEKNNLQEISLLIIDSDQKYANSPKGNTLKKLLKEEISQVVEIYTLYAHEVENLIPIKMIQNYYNNSKDEESRQEVINFLKLLRPTSFKESPLAYFDMKNGIEITKWERDEAYREYWKKNMEEIKYKYDEKIYIINGFGTNLLRKINNFFEEEMYKEDFFKNNVDDYLIETWNEIGKLIYSYGCSRQKQYIL